MYARSGIIHGKSDFGIASNIIDDYKYDYCKVHAHYDVFITDFCITF